MKVRDLVELPCKEVVELVTDYLSHSLDEGDRARFEQHLFACTWCMTYLKQVNHTIDATKQLAEPEPVDKAALAALFRNRKKGG